MPRGVGQNIYRFFLGGRFCIKKTPLIGKGSAGA